MIKLYGNTDSGHSYKIRNFLLLGSLPHDYVWIDLSLPKNQRPADFREVSQFGEVPVLVYQEQAYCQSNAILIFLAQKTRRFAGKTPQEWQQILEWLSWESNRIGFSLPNLRFSLHFDKQPPAVLNYLSERMGSDLMCLEKFLAGREYLVGNQLSIADISCSAYLFWLDHVGIHEHHYPHIQAWLNRMREHPHWLHPDKCMIKRT